MSDKKTVKYKVFSEELYKLQEKYNVTNDIVITNVTRSGRSANFIELGVQWSGLGVKGFDETKDFIDKLTKAAKAAKKFKYNGYMIEY